MIVNSHVRRRYRGYFGDATSDLLNQPLSLTSGDAGASVWGLSPTAPVGMDVNSAAYQDAQAAWYAGPSDSKSVIDAANLKLNLQPGPTANPGNTGSNSGFWSTVVGGLDIGAAALGVKQNPTNAQSAAALAQAKAAAAAAASKSTTTWIVGGGLAGLALLAFAYFGLRK